MRNSDSHKIPKTTQTQELVIQVLLKTATPMVMVTHTSDEQSHSCVSVQGAKLEIIQQLFDRLHNIINWSNTATVFASLAMLHLVFQ